MERGSNRFIVTETLTLPSETAAPLYLDTLRRTPPTEQTLSMIKVMSVASVVSCAFTCNRIETIRLRCILFAYYFCLYLDPTIYT